MDEPLQRRGTRHRGPGSAALAVVALDRLDPEAVQIEGPPDSSNLVCHVGGEGLKVPVAILVSDNENTATANRTSSRA